MDDQTKANDRYLKALSYLTANYSINDINQVIKALRIAAGLEEKPKN